MPKSKPSTAPAVDQAARLILCLGRITGSPPGLTRICEEIGIHKSKGLSILNALSRYNLVIRDNATKTYSLGPALIPLAQKAMEGFDIKAISKTDLENLARETKTSVLLGMVSDDRFYIAAKYDGNDLISVSLSQHQSLHLTHGAHGKAVFAFLAPDEQQRILDSEKRYFHGHPNTFDPKRLDREVRDCLKNGYAMDNGELAQGIRAVSAPVFDHTNRVMAAIVLVGAFPEDQFDALGKKTAAVAQDISRQAGASTDKEQAEIK